MAKSVQTKGGDIEIKETSANQALWGPVTSFIGTVLMFLIPQITAAALLASTGFIDASSFDDLSPTQVFGLYGLTQILVMALLLIFMNVVNAKPRHLGITKDNIKKIWYVAPVFVSYFVATTMVLTVLGLFLGESVLDQEQELGFEAGGGALEMSMAFVTLVVLAPVGEELLFRGFLFKGLKTKLDYRVAIFLSAALFGLAHGQINVGFDTFVLGVFLAWLLHKTDNIFIPIALHAAKNLLAFLLIFVFQVG